MGDEIFRDCDLQSVKTVALSKCVEYYEYLRKWIVEYLSKFQIRGIQIACDSCWKAIDFFNTLRAIPPTCDVIYEPTFSMNSACMRIPYLVYVY